MVGQFTAELVAFVRLRDGEGGREQGRGTVTETVTELSTGAECYGRDERFGI